MTMAYDEKLAQRLRGELGTLPGLAEKKMFGGICFLLGGNMACGVLGDDLIVRVGKTEYAASLAQPGARVFDFSGKPMAGWVTVAPAGYATEEDLARWVKLAIDFAGSLPAK
jgi:TfoX/Sxy family transcriptional regulator of competence genes